MLHTLAANIRCDRYCSNFLDFGVQLNKALQLIHGPLVSLTDFLGSCVQAGCKLTVRFSPLSSSLSSTSAFSRLSAAIILALMGRSSSVDDSAAAITHDPAPPVVKLRARALTKANE